MLVVVNQHQTSSGFWKAAGMFPNIHKPIASSGSNICKHNLASFLLYFVIRLVILWLILAHQINATPKLVEMAFR